MSYEQAKSTQMIATRCACCGRPLRNAPSVEAGMGQVCREKNGYGAPDIQSDWNEARALLVGVIPADEVAAWGDNATRAANVLVHRIAIEQTAPCSRPMARAIKALGFTRLASCIEERLDAADERLAAKVSIEIEEANGVLTVRAPYNAAAVERFRRVPGRRYAGNNANTFPVSSRRAVLDALLDVFEGKVARGPKGVFILERTAEPVPAEAA